MGLPLIVDRSDTTTMQFIFGARLCRTQKDTVIGRFFFLDSDPCTGLSEKTMLYMVSHQPCTG